MQILRSIIILLVLEVFLFGCSSGNHPVVKSSDNRIDSDLISNEEERVSSTAQELPTLSDSLPDPVFHERRLWVFADYGITAFYKLHKRVPNSYDEYLESGFPLQIPNDYLTGKPYRLVDELDLSDPSGFTFETDGNESCKFNFVIINDKTEVRETRTFKFNERHWEPYKTGLFSKNKYNFDWAKKEYCIGAFYDLSFAFMEEFGKAPESLADLMTNTGTLIEAGWQWSPVDTSDSKVYFEFGIDTGKARIYQQHGCKGECKPMNINVQQLYPEDDVPGGREEVEGINLWSYKSDENVPSAICNMKKFISSDSFYDGYIEISAAQV